MPRNAYDPKAYLATIKNVKAGLESRTKVLLSMECGAKTATEISQKSEISYARATHHLHLMMKERIVVRSGKKRGYVWTLTAYGQQRLVS